MRSFALVSLLFAAACGAPSTTAVPSADAPTTMSAPSASPTVAIGSSQLLAANASLCDAADCGPALGLATRLCDDGVHTSGPSGRCLRAEAGGCAWEVLTCPAPVGCATDADCRAVQADTGGCDCVAIPTKTPAPTGGPQCLVDPCAGQQATCVAGTCALTTCAIIDCAAPPVGCHYEGAVFEPCGLQTCGKLVCTGLSEE